MNLDTAFSIVTAPRHNSLHWMPGTVTWGDVLSWVDEPSDTKECGSYILGSIRPTTVVHEHRSEPCTGVHRRKVAVVSRSVVTLDVDHPQPGFVERVGAGLPGAHLIHTTHSSSPDSLRYRVLVPTDREMAPDEYHMVVSVLMERLGAEQFDSGSVQAERYMFMPAAQEPGWFASYASQGDALAVDELLRDFRADLSAMPVPKPGARKRNPFELDGVVGAFNRAYEIDAAVREYDLPYEQVGERWQLIGAKAMAGMGPVAGADGLFFSHHTSDPAQGQTCSVFDLVRLHRFGELDEASSKQTPVNRLPSHKAMLDLASGDARVVAELVGADFDPGDGDELAGNDWRLGLKLAQRTGRFLDCIQNWDLVVEHEHVFQILSFNAMSTAVEFTQAPPWRSLDAGGVALTGTDRAALAHHLERTYNVRPSRSLVDELIDVTAQRRRVNPVADYLSALEWDGVSRVETCLPGVEPTPYTRMVARKSMVAAVARMMEPGIKWDHALVLFGTEGLGKSWWIDRMSRGYASTLGRIGDKDTLLVMQRSWIMVSDEGYSLKKADSDVQKEFLTRTEDVYRAPYDREAVAHKRHSVIWGTTNDEVFLRRQEGNRRFLIVRCVNPVDFDLITDEYVGQVWAEAMALYLAGERLYLAGDEVQRAREEREEFTEEDALGGVLTNYLDTLVPEGWDTMSPDARRLWMANEADGMVSGTEAITETCSTQMWVEALGRRIGEHRRTDLLEITAALKHMPGWRIVPGRHRMHGYGPQVVFRRTEGYDLI